jgi:hypothetical protein
MKYSIFLSIPIAFCTSIAYANTTASEQRYIKYSDLKKHYANELSSYTKLIPTTVAPKNSTQIDGLSARLYPKTLNNSPFIYDPENERENEIRYFFEPNSSYTKELYLGALYSGVSMKNIPNNPTQWFLDVNNKLGLYGQVSGSNNMALQEPKKQWQFTKGQNFLSNIKISPNAEQTIIVGSMAEHGKKNNIKLKVDVGYGPVEVGVEHAQSSTSNKKVIRVKAISKVYSLDISNLQGVTSLNNTPYTQYLNSLHPRNYPMYISSMDYGYAIIAEIDMTSASKEVQNSINTAINKGIASANIGVDLGAAFQNSNVNATYIYHGITPTTTLPRQAQIDDIINSMKRESSKYMRTIAANPIGALPLSATFKYLHPKDYQNASNFVKINNLLNVNQYYAVIQQARAAFKPVTAEMTKAHARGVQSGSGGILGNHYDNIMVYFADRKPNASKTEATVSDSYWWFYRESEKHKTVSKSQWDKEGNDRIRINAPEIDENGNFYLYALFKNDNSSGARPKSTLKFNEWKRSDQQFNVNDIAKGKTVKVTFYNEDMQFDLKF